MEIPNSKLRRILVTGNAGSGKSTLARSLGAALDLPVHGLDRVVWQAGWQPTPLAQRDAALHQLASGTAWVIDGVSRIIEAQADLVVFLDVKPALCTWRCARRNLRYLFRSRPGLPANCPEILIIPQLLKIIWRFDRMFGRISCDVLRMLRPADAICTCERPARRPDGWPPPEWRGAAVTRTFSESM